MDNELTTPVLSAGGTCGLSVPLTPYFWRPGDAPPEEHLVWEKRDARILSASGAVVFEQSGVFFPASWSQTATNIVSHKYFRTVGGVRESSVGEMVRRVAGTIATWGEADGYLSKENREQFLQELSHILLNQMASFNSPVWFNIGVPNTPQQASACYILGVEDSMPAILEWYRQEGMIFTRGSGAGVNVSALRARGEPISKGGVSSGPLSFMRAADASAFSIKSGGTTRRSARMVVMDMDHPDILEFIQAKMREEAKAKVLALAGYDSSLDGEIYATVAHQNCNMSVSASDAFMQAAQEGKTWTTAWRTNAQITTTYAAKELLGAIAQAAWSCGDPGMHFVSTMNHWHTCPQSGPIQASNPCSEYIFLNDSACNLSSINLLKFLTPDGEFDTDGFCHTVDIMLLAMEILVSRSEYPTPAITQNSEDFRTLGLGYANLGALLMAKGLPYDSPGGRDLAAAVTALMTGRAYQRSAEIARVKGAFTGFYANRDAMLGVIDQHIDATETGYESQTDVFPVWQAAGLAWDRARDLGRLYGFRNAQVSLLAPTGTISFMMDCFTGDTLVATADGRNAVSLKQLAEEGEEVDVYASAYGKTVIKKMRNIGKIRADVPVVRVLLDDDSYVRCTPEHQFMLIDGSYKRADALQAGDSLMRFDSIIRSDSGKPRRAIWMGLEAGGSRLRGRSWQAQYRLIGARKFPGYDGRSGGIIHHDDDNSLNDCPDNLLFCDNFSAHLREHWAQRTPEERSAMIRERNLSLTPEQIQEKSRKIHAAQTPEQRRQRARKAVEAHTPEERAAWTAQGWANTPTEERRARIKKGWEQLSPEERTARAERIWAKRRANAVNHKVVAVVADGREDVYCGEVEDVHNFAIITSGSDPITSTLSGVVVHNCTTTGVEPDVALVSYKKLVGGGTLKHVNDQVPRALRALGYAPSEVAQLVAAVEAGEALDDQVGFDYHDAAVFDCAFPARPGGRSIAWQGHVKMVAALQPFLSGAISKTINLPADATAADVMEAFELAWRLGCKSIAVYRDGCKETQVLTTEQPEEGVLPAPVREPIRRRLPGERQAFTHKFAVGGVHEGYLTVGLYEDGQPGEIFLKMAKEGSTLSGFADGFAIMVSLALQYGVPLEALVQKFSYTHFEPAGWTGHPDLKYAHSILDYVFRYLQHKFLPDSLVPDDSALSSVIQTPRSDFFFKQGVDTPPCWQCGFLMLRNGSCLLCPQCGANTGCTG